jgi:hypothetical protein
MKLAEFYKTLILAGVVLFFAFPHGGTVTVIGSFVWVTAAVLFLPWAVYSLVRIVLCPDERRNRGIRLAIWTATIFITVAANGHWDAAARKEADAAVTAIVGHRSRTGAYPNSLADLGIDAQALRKKYSLAYRVDKDGKPTLLYSQPSMPTP